MRLALGIAALLFAACASTHAASEPAHHAEHGHHRFDDPEKWARVFDDPDRDQWQKPRDVVAALNLPHDAKVADLGAGTGYFTMRLAYAVPNGIVYGIDTEPTMVKYLEDRAARMQLANVKGVVCPLDDAAIPEPVDLVLIVDTYHHLSDREAYFRKLKDSLAPNGRIAIIDFTKEASMGPPVRERLTPGEVNSELTVAGYKLTQTFEFLPQQYFLVFQPLSK